jgi:hypothetical protein
MQRKLSLGWLIPVWIRVPGASLIQCAMKSASDHAAELEVDDPFALPDRFELLFSPIAQSWRECVVLSRRQHARSVSISFRGRHLDLYCETKRTASSKALARTNERERPKHSGETFHRPMVPVLAR